MSRTKLFQLASIVFVVAVGGVGCGKKDEGQGGAKPTTDPNAGKTDPNAGKTDPGPGPTPPPAGGKGTITGKVNLDGAAPKMNPLPRQSDPYCAKEAMNANYVVAAADGGLGDVLVRLPNGAIKDQKPPADPVMIDQKSCMYTPHVSGAMAGQTIAVKNSDTIMHNIHTYAGEENWFNEAQPPGAPELKKEIEADAGQVLKIACDVHKWMEAHVVLSDHPFYAVTGADGSFKIENVPAGTYELEAWHPHINGVVKAKVTVEDGKTAEAKLTFKASDYQEPK